VFASARDTMGAFFEPISRIDRETAARDFLDTSKSHKRAELLTRYAPLRGSKVLEIGSGFGTNVAVWMAEYAIDGYGVEPSSQGFDGAFEASKRLLAANGMDPARIVDAVGERLPFGDGSFDIVYSANVLEHTSEPDRVLFEAIRVLRPGGVLHMEIPNHMSYFEGHYMLLQPPLVHRLILPAWVSLFGRDPAFSKTIQTQINPIWCRRVLRTIGATYPLEILSLGEDVFLERFSRPFNFEAEGVATRLSSIVRLLQLVNRGNWIGRTIVAMLGHYPLYVTVRKFTA
jgi:ubiquinone/menaquinone biosynthesis C-methylase UbiE